MDNKKRDKLIEEVKRFPFCDYVKPVEKTVGVYNAITAMSSANKCKPLKSLLKLGYKIQYVIK